MVTKEEVLQFVKRKGPIIPLHIKRELGSDTITIGAMLSELTDAKIIKISHTKIGGSPNYYMPEQAPKLQELKQYLNDKQQTAFDLLKEKKILQDWKLEPVFRLSYRDIKDFAIPLEVNGPEGTEIFWKWYLTGNDEAEQLIRKALKIEKPKVPKPATKPVQKSVPTPTQKTVPRPVAKPTQKTLKPVQRSSSGDEFIGKLYRYFKRKNITIIDENIIRKNSEADFLISVPSAVGHQQYYCKAKSKKKCNDGDLSSAYLQGQLKKLPVLFLMTGEMTKKAEEMLGNEFKGMVVKHI